MVRCVPPHVRQSQNLPPLRGRLQKGQTTMTPIFTALDLFFYTIALGAGCYWIMLYENTKK